MKMAQFSQLFASVVTLMLASKICESCVYPTGLDTDPGIPTGTIFVSFVANPVASGGTSAFESPIQFRLSAVGNVAVYNARTAYYPDALDVWARPDVSESRRRCNDTDPVLFDLHDRATLAYVSYYSLVDRLPQSKQSFADILSSYGLDPNICDNDACLESVDPAAITTPWGLAFICMQESREFFDSDGWNADGSLSRDYNKIPYEDFRTGKDRYIPQNSPWKLTKQRRWQPLLESDELGFLFYQEHVTPHIGFTGKSVYLGDEYICNAKAPNPRYRYSQEMRKVLERTAQLTDVLKMQVEYFDNKFNSLIRLLVQFYIRQGLSPDSWEFYKADFITIMAVYEATLVVWKEKVRHDLVRPPSIIEERLSGRVVTSYAGTTPDGESFGTQNLLADDWEPYIRTMPHAEYPSGSACVCKAFANSLIEYTGVDNVVGVIGGPLVAIFDAFSSVYEPLSTPRNTTNVFYNSWTEIAEACGESGLDGGMHFEASVPAGYDLCGDTGIVVAKTLQQIFDGIVPDSYVVDFNDREIPNRDCY